MLSAPFSYLTAGSVESPSFHRRTTTLLTNFERNFEKEEGENSGHTHTHKGTRVETSFYFRSGKKLFLGGSGKWGKATAFSRSKNKQEFKVLLRKTKWAGRRRGGKSLVKFPNFCSPFRPRVGCYSWKPPQIGGGH